MVKLGVSQEQAKALRGQRARANPGSRACATVNNAPVVQLDENFDRAWRRVGLALDRTGFTVEDRDRSQGMYFVRYVEPTVDKKEPGFFGKLFGGDRQRPFHRSSTASLCAARATRPPCLC
jgi:outer membrane protein assembly factor BamC